MSASTAHTLWPSGRTGRSMPRGCLALHQAVGGNEEEKIESHPGFRIPVRRLRYEDGREIALHGDDVLGVNDDERERQLLPKGESRSRRRLSNGVVTDARERLCTDDGRPTPISLLFVVDRLLEAVDEGDPSLG